MKKLLIAVTCIFGIIVMNSCSLETSNNGDLDGFWHIVSIDSINTGNSLNLKESKLFWSIQSHLLDTKDTDLKYEECISHFEKVGDSLFIKDSYIYNRAEGDIKIDDIQYLSPYGINKLGEHFKILQLNSDEMLLSSESLRIRFQKL